MKMKKNEKVRENFTDRLVTHRSPRSPIAEAYRTLRTNIQFGSLDRTVKTIMFTSAGPGEGKSTTASNLAVTLAQAGHAVILVDADLRRPVQHRVFALDQRNGLTAMLLGRCSLDEAVQSTAIGNLRVLPSGPPPPNPSETLGSHAMEELLTKLGGMADYVIIDAPPAIAVADASILAPKVDGVVLVLRSRKVTRQIAEQAKAQLEKVNARFLGAVLNDIQVEGDYKYYYYDYIEKD